MRRMFSEKQIEKITEEGLLSPDTLEQKEYNFETDLTAPEEIELNEVAFMKAVVINKVLYIVGEAKITNVSESAISNPQFKCSLPENISKHIYRRDGSACNVNYDANSTICRDFLIADYTAGTAGVLSYNANEIIVVPFRTINAGASIEISFRIPIIL